MNKAKTVKLFEQQSVRTDWDEAQEKWFFSIVDVVAVLTSSKNPQAYWRKLNQRLKAEGNETVTICHGLKMPAQEGLDENKSVAQKGGHAAKQARLETEKQTGGSVVNRENAQQLLGGEDGE